MTLFSPSSPLFRELRLVLFALTEVPQNIEKTTADRLQALKAQVEQTVKKAPEKEGGKAKEMEILTLKDKEDLQKQIEGVRKDLEAKGQLTEETKSYLDTLKQFVDACPTEKTADKGTWDKMKEKFDAFINQLTSWGSSTLQMIAGWFKADSWIGQKLRALSETAEAQIAELMKQFPSLQSLKEKGMGQLDHLQKVLTDHVEKIRQAMQKSGASAEAIAKCNFVEYVKSIAKKLGQFPTAQSIEEESGKRVAAATEKPAAQPPQQPAQPAAPAATPPAAPVPNPTA